MKNKMHPLALTGLSIAVICNLIVLLSPFKIIALIGEASGFILFLIGLSMGKKQPAGPPPVATRRSLLRSIIILSVMIVVLPVLGWPITGLIASNSHYPPALRLTLYIMTTLLQTVVFGALILVLYGRMKKLPPDFPPDR